MFGFKTRTLVIAGAITAIIGSGAYAARNYQPSHEDRAYFATYMITKKLELNDAQEAGLDNLAKSWIGTAGNMKTFRKSILDDVKKMATGDDLSVEQVNALRDKIKAEIDSRADEIVPQFVSFYNSLDGDQKAKIVSKLDEVSERMEKGGFRHHRRDGHGMWKHGEGEWRGKHGGQPKE